MIIFKGPNNQTITIRDPDLQDVTRTNLKAKYKRAMDGSLYGWRMGQATKTMKMVFSSLEKDKRVEMISFVSNVAGQLINMQADSDPQIAGKFLGSGIDVTESGRSKSSFTIEFEFIVGS